MGFASNLAARRDITVLDAACGIDRRIGMVAVLVLLRTVDATAVDVAADGFERLGIRRPVEPPVDAAATTFVFVADADAVEEKLVE